MTAAQGNAKAYLGDSVYVEIEAGMVKLTTNNGYPDDPRNVIYLDDSTLRAFEAWLHSIRRLAEENES